MLNVIASTVSGVVSTDFVTQCLPENSQRIFQAVKNHFKGQQDPLHELLSQSYKTTLKSLDSALGSKANLLSSKETKDFHQRFVSQYWSPFAQEMNCTSHSDQARLKAICAKGCKSLLDRVDGWLLPIDHQELASLLFELPKQDGMYQPKQNQSTFEADAKRDLRRQIQRAHIDDHTTDFLLFNDLLYSCLFGRFQEQVKRSPLVQNIFTIYKQNKISVDFDQLKVNFEESQQNLRNHLQTLTAEVGRLAGEYAKAPHQPELISRLSELASAQSATQRDLQSFDQRFSEVQSTLVGISSELYLFHNGFNAFANLCEEKLDQINEGVNDIRGKVDHLIDLVQVQGLSTPLPIISQKQVRTAVPVPSSAEKLHSFLSEQLLTCLRVYPESMEREFFIEAAMLNIPPEESTRILKEVLHQASIEREKDVISKIRIQMEPNLKSGYFSPNEVNNILYIAEKHKLPKDKILRLIKDECLRTSCVNGPEVADRFKKFLEISYPPSTPFQDLSPFLDWAERNRLKRRDARAILRAYCTPHPLPSHTH